MPQIADNILRIRKEIEATAILSGRDPKTISIVCVSKTHGPELIREAYEAGLKKFGENYAQELKEKAEVLAGLAIEWHFIGHLQKNKAKIVVPIASSIETIDSAELATALSSRAIKPIDCLIEVNVGREASKSGVLPDDLTLLAKQILALPNLNLRGLMTIPPFDPDAEKSRPYFRTLKGMLDKLNDDLVMENPLRGLSMGMSHDFRVAIEEGATIVRIGTAIFGERK